MRSGSVMLTDTHSPGMAGLSIHPPVIAASALADSHLALHENDPAKGRVICRFAPLDDGIRFGIQYYPSDNSLTVYLGVTSSASRNQRRLEFQYVSPSTPKPLRARAGSRTLLPRRLAASLRWRVRSEAPAAITVHGRPSAVHAMGLLPDLHPIADHAEWSQ